MGYLNLFDHFSQKLAVSDTKLKDLALFSVACLSHQLLQYSLVRHPLLQNHFREKGGLAAKWDDRMIPGTELDSMVTTISVKLVAAQW